VFLGDVAQNSFSTNPVPGGNQGPAIQVSPARTEIPEFLVILLALVRAGGRDGGQRWL
jgi:hypothetical protein